MTSRISAITLALFALLLFPVSILSQIIGSEGGNVSELREQVAAHFTRGDYGAALALLEAPARAENSDNEARQYALLTTGEIHLIYLGQAERAIDPLETLVSSYFRDSPYVSAARYHLGSLYMDRDDAINAFTHLAQVPEGSTLYTDARVKLDWASKNLRHVVRLPLGFEITIQWMGIIGLVADVLFTLLWVTQAVLSKGKNKYVWAVLIVLAMFKIALSLQLTQLAS